MFQIIYHADAEQQQVLVNNFWPALGTITYVLLSKFRRPVCFAHALCGINASTSNIQYAWRARDEGWVSLGDHINRPLSRRIVTEIAGQ